jgi:hypothetical protein
VTVNNKNNKNIFLNKTSDKLTSEKEHVFKLFVKKNLMMDLGIFWLNVRKYGLNGYEFLRLLVYLSFRIV